MDYTNQFGDYFIDNSFRKYSVNELLNSKKYAILLFSGSTCPPCQKLAPVLKSLYEKYKDDVEIIWVPADDVNEFKTYFPKQPWKCIPLESNRRYKISIQTYTKGIPQLWLFNTQTGKILSNSIPKIMNFNPSKPWTDHLGTLNYSWGHNLLSDTVYDKDENPVSITDVLKKKMILLVFLLPQVRSYEVLRENLEWMYNQHQDEIEIVWVPDNSTETYLKLKKELPGLHIEYGDQCIQKIVKLTELMKRGLPLFHPIINDTGDMKKNSVKAIMYAKETLKMPRVLARKATEISLSSFV